MNVAAVIPAAGFGRRLNAGTAKPYLRVLGRPLLVHTLLNLESTYPFVEMIVAVAPSRMVEAKKLLKKHGLGRVRLVRGGRTRADSVQKAVNAVSTSSQWVLVHDAARPFVHKALVKKLLNAARVTGAALSALSVTATVKKSDAKGQRVLGTLDRRFLFLAQTPQLFKKELLLDQYRRWGRAALQLTDEAALFDGSGIDVKIVQGRAGNFKVTTPEDLELFKFYMNKKGDR